MTQEAISNPVELFDKATQHARVVLAGVQQDQLGSPTPCSEWNVKDLINHLIGGAENAKAALTGNPGQMEFCTSKSSCSAETDAGKLASAYNARISEALEAASRPGALEFKVPSPIGDMTSGQFLAAIFMDQLIHVWDLAKATDQNTRLDPGLVELCYAMCVPDMVDMGRAMGVIGPVVPVPDRASTQDKLLGYLGRQP